MANIYKNIDSNVFKTWLLMVGFGIFVIGIGWLLSRYYNNFSILIFAAIIAFVQTFGSYWFSDKLVIAATRAQEIKESDDARLYHIVQNLCITAGLPMPKVYIMPELQPNAFATGRDKNHSAIVFTQGLLDMLDESELEGVAAHELSHIGNRDTLLQTVVVGLVAVLSLLSEWFLRMGRWQGDRDNDSQVGAIIGLLSLVGVILAPIIGTMIQLAISRKREFLADSSAVLLTRYPDGLANALIKISSSPVPMHMQNDSIAHLFISSPFKGEKLAGLFATHPPIQERIKAIKNIVI